MELLGLAVLLIVALGIVILIVILVTRGVFARDLTKALKRVTQQEEVLQGKADILEQRLSQMEQEYETKLKRAETEAEQVLREAKNQAMNIRTAAIEEAKHRARQLMLEAEQGKVQLRAEVAKELNGQVIQRAGEALRTLLSAQELQSVHGMLVKELLDTLNRSEAVPRQAAVERVEVTTGQPLAESAAHELTQWVGKAVGEQVPIEITVDPSLVAGCVIRMGATILDNSLLNRLGRR